MICKFCGTDIEDESVVCRNCHQQLVEPNVESKSDMLLEYYTQKKKKDDEKKAKSSVILGAISLIAWLLPLIGYPISIVGIVMGSKGLSTAKSSQAKVGIALSIIGLIATISNSVYGVILRLGA